MEMRVIFLKRRIKKMIKCNVCNCENPENAVYCSKCGSNLGAKTQDVLGFFKSDVLDLVTGIITISIAFGCIIFAYVGILGNLYGDQIIIIINMTPEKFASTMLIIWLAILFFGTLGGFSIGKYVQKTLIKRKLRKS